jgi:hypothetical protein
MGRDSVVGIATHYELDGLGSNSGGGKIFRTPPQLAWGPPSFLYKEYLVFLGNNAAGG